MKAKITDACILCGACAAVCPTSAIKLAADGGHYEVDPAKCIGCGACVINCPVEAILKIEERGK